MFFFIILNKKLNIFCVFSEYSRKTLIKAFHDLIDFIKDLVICNFYIKIYMIMILLKNNTMFKCYSRNYSKTIKILSPKSEFLSYNFFIIVILLYFLKIACKSLFNIKNNI